MANDAASRTDVPRSKIYKAPPKRMDFVLSLAYGVFLSVHGTLQKDIWFVRNEWLHSTYNHIEEKFPAFGASDDGQLSFIDAGRFAVDAFENLSDFVVAHPNILIIVVVSFGSR